MTPRTSWKATLKRLCLSSYSSGCHQNCMRPLLHIHSGYVDQSNPSK